MFRHSPCIPWDRLLLCAVQITKETYSITNGSLACDDFDRHRSKRTKKIHGVHKIRNKKGGGFVDAQNIVLLTLVTRFVTFPVGFSFYRPNPAVKAWKKEDMRLRKLKIKKKDRPKEPPRNLNYPTKKELFCKMLRQFKYYNNDIKINSILVDNLYITRHTKTAVSRIYPKTQFISQFKSTQTVKCQRRGKISLEKYFKNIPLKTREFTIRSGLKKTIEYAGHRLWVVSHKCRYHVVAYRYVGEEKFRYLCATDLTWRSEEIITAYAYRWLTETEIEDLKLFHGWGKGAMQQGVEGASRSLIQSLLLDHFLLCHPEQTNLYRTGRPLHTAGSLQTKLQFDGLFQTIEAVVDSQNPKEALRELMKTVDNVIELRPSRKHMAHYDIVDFHGRQSSRNKYRNTG